MLFAKWISGFGIAVGRDAGQQDDHGRTGFFAAGYAENRSDGYTAE